MIYGSVVRLEYRTTVNLWVFPSHPFVEYGPDDEHWARYCSFGEEKEFEQSVVIPRAMITRVKDDGVEFVALPEIGYAEPILRLL